MTSPDLFGYIEALTQNTVEFTRAHGGWAPMIAFAVAFSESFAFLSLLVPGWAMLIGIGALIGAGGLALWPTWLAASFGAAMGDSISYAIGHRFKGAALRVWPLSRHPDLVRRGNAFFAKWGAASVFIGRFFGPLRAIVPLVAGTFEMAPLPFQAANIGSALVWAFVLLAPIAELIRHFLPG